MSNQAVYLFSTGSQVDMSPIQQVINKGSLDTSLKTRLCVHRSSAENAAAAVSWLTCCEQLPGASRPHWDKGPATAGGPLGGWGQDALPFWEAVCSSRRGHAECEVGYGFLSLAQHCLSSWRLETGAWGGSPAPGQSSELLCASVCSSIKWG